MYELINWHPVQPQEITAETYLRLPIDLKLLYRRKVSATVQKADREEKPYYPFQDDANRTDDPQGDYKQKKD